MARHVEKLPVEKYEHYWGRLHYEGDFWLEGFLSFHKSNLYFQPIDEEFKKIRVDYAEIIWCEERTNVFGEIGLETPLFLILFFDELLKNSLLIAFKEMGSALLVVGIWIIPLTILSILNRKHFGKIVCTMDEQGIYYRNELIPWNSIREIEYEIVIILSAPYYLLQKAKEYNPAIKVDL